MNQQRIVLATNNAGKVKELNGLLTEYGYHLVTQSVYAIQPVEETGLSFIENAILKARHAAKESGLPAIADDSGLVVEALHGAPGIYSARYAGEQANSQQNMEKLLLNLAAVADHQRQAYFYCALVYLRHQHDPMPLICQGRWQGEIARQPIGEGGFGYDPIFFLPHLAKSAAQLTIAEKSRLSHRGQALKQLVAELTRV